MRRSATDILPASAFLTAGVADPHSVTMSMAKLLPFKQVTFLIPLALIYKFSFQFFTGAMEEEEEDEENEARQIYALCAFSQVVEAHAKNLDTVATVALQAFLLVAAM